HPLVVKRILHACLGAARQHGRADDDDDQAPSSEGLSAALAELRNLHTAGYAPIDLCSTMFKVARTLDLDESVETVLDSLEAKAQARGVKLQSELEGEETVHADPTALEQILTNYLDNAIKYAPKDGNVWIRADVDDHNIRIEVQDDGPGIEPIHRKRVFERFYRVDKGRARDVGGTGLGLSICKHLAEAMHGGVGCDA
ncbi:MAG: ATP-binding protein, partial [Myxococcota bacterium]